MERKQLQGMGIMPAESKGKLRLIMVDPKNSKKTEVSPAKSSKLIAYQKSKSKIQQKCDLPVVMHTFEGGRVEKVSLSSKKVIMGKKGSHHSLPHKLVIKTDPKYSLGMQSIQSKGSASIMKKPVAFVPSRTNDYSLEYANAWQSSFDFDGKKPLRPLFRITTTKSKRKNTDAVRSQGPFNAIDPNFPFGRNSLGKIKGGSKSVSRVDHCANPIFKVSLKSQRRQ